MNLIPAIGTKGIYSLSEPFNTLVDSTIEYTCKSVRGLAELVASGVDAKELYYTNNNLSADVYTADFNNGVCLIGLVSNAGAWVYVPSSYISSYPNMSGVSYTGMAILLKLVPVPDKLVLTDLVAQLVDKVADEIGVSATSQIFAYTQTKALSQTDHAILESARTARVANSDSDASTIIALRTQNAALTEKVTQLEQHILTNG